MAYEFKLPDLGEGLTEGEIARWLVAEGDEIAEDDPLVEVQTDKTTVEIPSPAAGKVARILVAEGEVVPVGTVLVVIGEEAPAPSRRVASTGRSGRAGVSPGTARGARPRDPARPQDRSGARRRPRDGDRHGAERSRSPRRTSVAGPTPAEGRQGAAARCPPADRRAHGARAPRGCAGDLGRGVRLLGRRPEAADRRPC